MVSAERALENSEDVTKLLVDFSKLYFEGFEAQLGPHLLQRPADLL